MTAAVLLLGVLAGADAPITTWPAPPGEPASADYSVSVEGVPVFCYTSYHFRADSAQTIAGRPVSPLSFASFDLLRPAEVTVNLLDGLRAAGLDASTVTVRPLSAGHQPEVVDGTIRLRVERPCQLTIEPAPGRLHPLHLFINPPEEAPPDPADPNVLYFGPGRHELGATALRSGQTVYVAGGAIVSMTPLPADELKAPHELYGLTLHFGPTLFDATRQRGITFRGRGILCGRQALEQLQRGALLKFHTCEDITVEGIILREAAAWSLDFVNSRDVRVRNVKVVGHYVNNDGIVIGGTSNAVVEDCFSHNADDSLEVKVWIPQSNVIFRRCVVWNDIGGALGLCCETGAELTKVLFEDCTVIHALCESTCRGVIGLDLQGPGSVKDVSFRNIVIEDAAGPVHAPLKVMNNWDDWHMFRPTPPGRLWEQAEPPQRDHVRGAIRDVLFENVRVLRSDLLDVVVMADAATSPIEGVTFAGVTLAGTPLVTDDPRLKTNAWVSGVAVR